MEKVKRFVVLPLGLLLLNLIIGIRQDPWTIWSVGRLDSTQKLGSSLLSLLCAAVYILFIAFLFVLADTRSHPAELFKKTALTAMATVFVAGLAAKLALDLFWQARSRTALEAAKHGADPGVWYSVPLQFLTTAIHFAVLYFTLRLLLKPLNLSFTPRKRSLLLVLLIYIIGSVLEEFLLLRLVGYLNEAGRVTLDSVNLLGTTISMSGFNALFVFGSGLLNVLLDLLIFEYFRRCIQSGEKTAPKQNAFSN